MRHVSEIEKTFDTALIIASGHSAKTYDYSLMENMDVWAVNYDDNPIEAEYILYYDKDRAMYFDDNPRTGIICYDGNKSVNAEYYYNKNDIIFCDSGSHALQICSNVLKYTSIYLIGYDYYTEEKKLRRVDENEYTEKEKIEYEKVIFNRALHRYTFPYCKHVDLKTCDCKSINIWQCRNIYNLNLQSRLKLFPFKEGNKNDHRKTA